MSIKFNKDPLEIEKRAKTMKISAHTLVTNPETLGYPYIESIKSFADFCDEVIVVDGGTTDGSLEKIKEIPNVRIVNGEKWEKDFWWGVLGKNINIGFKECKNNWAFHFDTDYIFHEDNVKKLKEELAKCHLAALEIRKVNSVMADERFLKQYTPLLVNKKDFPAVCYGIGQYRGKGAASKTFLNPIARTHTRKDGLEEGEPVLMKNIRVCRGEVDVYTYDFTFMTKEQVIEQRYRFENSLRRMGGDKTIVTKDSAFRVFLDMMRQRHKECKKIKLEEHSKFIREKVENIRKDQFGHSMWGMYLDS